MSNLDNLVQDFLAQKKIAVVGVSDQRETGCNLAYKKFKENGYQVYAVNPRITFYDGATCYPDLKSIPEKPDAVFTYKPKSSRTNRPTMRRPWRQTCLDTLHVGNKTGFGGKHD
jgi:predicted CoA-binding protein